MNNPQWETTVTNACNQTHPGTGIVLLMPEYRPDICRAIAVSIGAKFFDFRREVMQELKMLAHQVTLEELTKTLSEESDKGDALAFNVESLLSIKPEAERQQWLDEFMSKKWRNRVLLPLAIFQHEVSSTQSNTIDLQNYSFHEQTLISRLAM